MPGWINEFLIYGRWIIFAIAHLAGLVVAIILLNRAKSTPATLGAVSFGVLFLQDIGRILRRLFLDNVMRNLTGIRGIWEVNNCCCGIFQVAAIVCLVVAVWQAISGDGTEA
jgi:hypothetical protein